MKTGLWFVKLLCVLFLLRAEASAADSLAIPRPLSAVDKSEPAYRVPADVAWYSGSLYVANSRTGTVSCLDAETQQVTGEWKAAESLSGLLAWRDSLLLLDDASHRLLRVQTNPAGVDILLTDEISVAGYPVEIIRSADDSLVAVTSLWSRRLTVLTENSNGRLQVLHSAELPFSPRCSLFLPESRIVVADAFGDRLLVMDSLSGRVLSERRIHGHNIRGLCQSADGEQLHVAHQNLSDSYTSYEQVFWGVVMQNGLTSIPVAELLSARTELTEVTSSVSPRTEMKDAGGTMSGSEVYSASQTYPLGTPSVGSGDPYSIVISDNDTTFVLLAGVNQIAYRTASHMPFSRLPAGRRPEAICFDDQQRRAFVSGRFDDSIMIIALGDIEPVIVGTVPLGVQRPLTLSEQGEQLFYDARLSLDGWFSCHSCHTDGHTNSRLADTLGDEGQGAPKTVLSLLGAGDTGPWAWNGSKHSLEKQIHTSLIISMQTQIPTEELPIEPLAAYIKTLRPPPSLYAASRDHLSTGQLELGKAVFDRAGCAECHRGDTLTSESVYNVGLSDQAGGVEFNPPSLRGVSQRTAYFHDSRALSLRDVLISGHHGRGISLTEAEISALEMLLKSF